MTTSPRQAVAIAVGLTLGALGLAGCTSPSTPASTSTSTSAAQGGTQEQARERWESDLKSCLAGQGFDVPDEGQADFGSRQAEYELASQQCQNEVGSPPGAATDISPEQRAAEVESAAAANTCFREAGFSEGVGDDPDLMVEPEGVPADVSEKCWAAADEALELALAR